MRLRSLLRSGWAFGRLLITAFRDGIIGGTLGLIVGGAFGALCGLLYGLAHGEPVLGLVMGGLRCGVAGLIAGTLMGVLGRIEDDYLDRPEAKETTSEEPHEEPTSTDRIRPISVAKVLASRRPLRW